MMLFKSELGWSVLGLLSRFVGFGRLAPLQKRETKGIGEGSPEASLVLSGGREDQLFRE